MQCHTQTVWISCFGQQFFSASWIIGIGFEFFARTEKDLVQQLTGWNRLTFHHARNDRIAIDHFAQGASNSLIGQGVGLHWLAISRSNERRICLAIAIHVQVDHAVRDSIGHLDALVFLEFGGIRGGHALDHVYITRKQSRDAGRCAGDDAKGDLIPVRLIAPVVIVACDDHAVARDILLKTERTCTDHRFTRVEILGLGCFSDRLGHNRNGHHVGGQQRIGCLSFEADGVIVDNVDVNNRADKHSEGGRAIRHIGHALDRSRNVLCGEGLAVVPFHTLAEFKFPLGIG